MRREYRAFPVLFPRLRVLAMAVLGLALAACGNLTAGGLSEAEVTVSGDAPEPAAAPVAGTGADAPSQQEEDDDDADEAEGEIEADFLIFLQRPDGSEVPLTDQEIQVDVDVQGQREVVAVERTIPAGRYTGLRLHFSEIEVQIDAGLVIDGVPITGLVSVDVEVEGVEVNRVLSLDLEDGDRVAFLLDMNAKSWLTAVDPLTLEVAAQAFADAIVVRQR